jgi:ABC-type microcin C transport system permease subunit YejB
MTRYLLRRLLQAPLLLLGIVAFTFVLIHVAPGDPIVALAGEYGNQAYYEQMRAKFGLDRPLAEQLIIYLSNLMRGDLGHSYTYGQPIVHTSLMVGQMMLIEASLAFLGLGDPNHISLGFLLKNAQSFLRLAWWMSLFPGLAIALAVLGFNLLGDSINDARGRHRRIR